MNKKNIFITIITILFLIISINTFADEDIHGKTIEEVLEIIRKDLNLKKESQINPDKVKDKYLEELGEAVMSLMHPDERQHELMDNMMGGEGSKSLESAHIMMGYRYLSGNNSNGNFGSGMMGRAWGMPMHGSVAYQRGWHGNSFFSIPGGGFMFFGLIILIAVIIAVYVFYSKNKLSSSSALEILKTRYAKGEISKKEFEEMKKDLQ